MNVIEALNWRYAVKTFSDKKLQQWQVDKLLEATRLSPSSYGLQPYKIIVVQSEALRQAVLPCAYNQRQVVDCSHLLVFAARTDIGPHLAQEYVKQASKLGDIPSESLIGFSNMAENAINNMTSKQQMQWAHQQAYIALGNMLTSAAMMQIDTSPIGGFEAKGVDQALGLADKHLTTTMLCPTGFRATEDKYSTRSKVRFGRHQIVLEM